MTDPFDDRCRRCGTPLLLEFDPYGETDADDHCDRCMDLPPRRTLRQWLSDLAAGAGVVVFLLRWMTGR